MSCWALRPASHVSAHTCRCGSSLPKATSLSLALSFPQMKPEQVERSHSSSEGLQNLVLLVNVAWRQECPDRSPCHGSPVGCSLWSKKSQGWDLAPAGTPPACFHPPGSSLCFPSQLSVSSLCVRGLRVLFHLLKSARLCEGEVGAEAPACR